MARNAEEGGRGSSARRALWLLSYLSRATEPVPRARLLAELGVSERHLQNLLDAFRQVARHDELFGVERTPDPQDRRRYRYWAPLLGRTRRIRHLAQIEQLATLRLLELLATVARPFERDARSLLRTVREHAPGPTDERTRRRLQRLETALYHRPWAPRRYTEDQQEAARILLEAALDCRVVRVVHRAAHRDGSATERLLEPWSLVVYREALYLLARHHETSHGAEPDGSPQLKLYAVDRIEDVQRRPERFELPDGWHPEQYFAGRLGIWHAEDEARIKLHLRFTPEAARLARARDWPLPHEWKRPPGEAEATLLVIEELPWTREVVSWLLSWGDAVEVLRPIAAREQIAEAARALAARYAPRMP